MFTRMVMYYLLLSFMLFIACCESEMLVEATTCPTTSNILSVREWLNTLNEKACNIQVTITKLERLVSLLSKGKKSSSLMMRQAHLDKVKKTQLVLIEEIEILNSTCNSFDGPDCNIPKCVSKCDICDYGYCVSCEGNWEGANCSTCTIGWSGINCTTPVCSVNCDICKAPGDCQLCKTGWTETNCTTPICNVNCDVCIEPGDCQTCKTGWSGSNCTTPICNVNCDNCIEPGVCQTCKSGWTETNCTTPICSVNCDICNAPGDCQTCKTGWTEANCTTPICNVNCDVCIEPGVCQTCKSGWTETNCTTPICNVNCDICNAPGDCQTCKSGWSGPNCDVKQLMLSNNAFKYGGVSLKSCSEYKSVLANSVSGLYWIMPNGINEFVVYCEQSFNSGGWILISSRKAGTVPYYSDVVNPNNDGASMKDDSWAMVRSISTDIMWRDASGSNGIGVSLISFWNSARCKTLTTKLTDLSLAHHEISGCDGSGTDYCYLGGNLLAYNSYVYAYCGVSYYKQWTFGAANAYMQKANVYVR